MIGLLGLVSALLFVSLTAAEDWPQFLGPNRDGTSSETGLLSKWSKKGPPLVWQKKIGDGFSGPVVVGKKLLLFHSMGNKEVVDCLNAETGESIWKSSYPCDYQDNFGKGDGPRSTPVVANKRIYTLGADGYLQCLALKDGKKLWGRSLQQDYDIPANFFGVGTSTVVGGNMD